MQKLTDLLLVLFMAAVLTVSVVRASAASLTYDEAFTYEHFVRTIDDSGIGPFFRSLRYEGESAPTNNHWMNTLLIYASEKIFRVPFNEFVIRLPSLLFFVIFLCEVFRGYRKEYYGGIAVLFLTGNYYLGEFYSLARGYGMAHTLVFTAVLFYIGWKKSEYKKDSDLLLCAVFLALAIFANTVVLFVMPAFGLMWLIRLIEKKDLWRFLKKRWWFVLLFFTYLITTAYFQMLAGGDKFADKKNISFLKAYFGGFLSMFVNKKILMAGGGILLLILAAGAVFLLKKEIEKQDLFLIVLIFTLTDLAASRLLHNEYVAGRFALPFFGLIVLSFSDLFRDALRKLPEAFREKHKAWEKTAGMIAFFLIFAFLILQFGNKMSVTKVRDWPADEKRQEMLLAGYLLYGEYTEIPDDKGSFSDVFYRDKIEQTEEEYRELYGE